MPSFARELFLDIFVDGTKIDDKHLGILSVVSESNVNQIPLLKLRVTEGDPSLALAKKDENFSITDKDTYPIGKKIEVKVGFKEDPADVLWQGFITGQQISNEGLNVLTVYGHGDAIKMTEGVRHQVFEAKKKDTDIIKKLIEDSGAKVGDVAKSDIEHSQYFAYQQTPWRTMMSRVLTNGFLFVPTLKDNQVVDLAKLKPKAIEIKMYESNIETFHLSADVTSEIKEVSATAWDIKKQEMHADKKGSAGFLSDVTKAPQKPAVLEIVKLDIRDPAPISEIEAEAKAKAQIVYRGLDLFRGKICFMIAKDSVAKGLKLLDVLDLSQVGSSYKGKYLVTGVKNSFDNGLWRLNVTLGLPLNHSLFSDWLYVPPVPNLIGHVADWGDGDPENLHRIPVWLPTITKDNKAVVWARLLTPFASKKEGVHLQPNVKDEVVVGFLGGSSSYPFIVGSTHNPKNEPPFKYDKEIKKRGLFFDPKADADAPGLAFLCWDQDKKIMRLQGGKKTSIDLRDDKGLILGHTDGDEPTATISILEKEVTLLVDKKNHIELKSKIDIETAGAITVKATGVTIKAKTEIK